MGGATMGGAMVGAGMPSGMMSMMYTQSWEEQVGELEAALVGGGRTHAVVLRQHPGLGAPRRRAAGS